MELSGIITQGKTKHITCCLSVNDILIDGKSLYDTLDTLFSQDAEDYWNNGQKESPHYGIRYVILDEKPANIVSFQQQAAETVMAILYAEHNSGCYSEFTCGYGGFDYVHQEGGHSIFGELAQHIGKYIHFKI